MVPKSNGVHDGIMEKFKFNAPTGNKESKLFKKMCRFYESRNYKSGIKIAKSILNDEKCKKHVDTLCLYALMLYYNNEKNEAIKIIKLAISNNFQSSISWHIYALLNKYSYNYQECIKCYIKAIQFDNNNYDLIMDLSIIQIHISDFIGCVENRKKLLKYKGSIRQNWLAYIIPLQLSQTSDIVDKLLLTLIESFETLVNTIYLSNILVYYIQILVQNCKYHEALSYIESRIYDILDDEILYQIKFDIYDRLKNKRECIKYCVKLLKLNPYNNKYYYMLEDILDNKDILFSLYQYLCKIFPTCLIPCSKILHFIQNQSLQVIQQYITNYIILSFNHGQFNIFHTIKSLYTTYPDIITLIPDIFLDLINNNLNNSNLYQIWLYYNLINHYFYIQDYTNIPNYINIILQLDPLFIDAYLFHSLLSSKIGNIQDSILYLQKAYDIDKSDRYINVLLSTTLIKYHSFQQGISIFKHYVIKDYSFWEHIYDIQFIHYIYTTSLMLYHQFDYSRARDVSLLSYSLQKTLNDDPIDFHYYCLRKLCSLTYPKMLQNINEIIHPNLFKIYRLLIKICFYHISNPNISVIQSKEYDEMFKILQNIQPIDPPLEIISNCIMLLSKYDTNLKNHFLYFEYYYLIQKPLLLLTSIHKLVQYFPTHPYTNYCFIRFLQYYQSHKNDHIQIFSKFTQYTSSPMTLQTDIKHPLYNYYDYKIKVFLSQVTFNIDHFIDIFHQSILEHHHSWKFTKIILDTFIHDHIIYQYQYVRKVFIDRIIQYYPQSLLNLRLSIS